MDFSKTLFRASCNGRLMVEPRSKSETLSETTKTYLRQLYREIRYNRKYEFSNKYVEKGNAVEEDSLTLYSRVKKTFFKKNEIKLTNEFICGTPDVFTGLEISAAETIIDIKSSWSLFTFPFPGDPINKDYYYQLQSYMALSGAKTSKLVYCLVNTPETFLLDEKRKLFYRMNAGTEENPDYVKACEELEKAMMFDDIPMSERVIEFEIARNDLDIEALYKKVIECRKYLVGLETKLNPQGIIAEHFADLNTTILKVI